MRMAILQIRLLEEQTIGSRFGDLSITENIYCISSNRKARVVYFGRGFYSIKLLLRRSIGENALITMARGVFFHVLVSGISGCEVRLSTRAATRHIGFLFQS
jgi:hypothetical protein